MLGTMTSPRLIVSGATTAITRRTTLRKAFLGAWDPLVQQCWLYALADAQRHTGVAIHHGVLVINHEHLVVTPSRDNLPEFTRRVHRDVSCAINTLLANQRYDCPRELFDGRAGHYQRLCDDSAQVVRLLYDHLNCVAAGLVERPEHMPGYAFHFELWRGGYLDVKRPAVYFGGDNATRPSVIRMHVTPPPLLYEAFGGDVDRLIYHLRRLREDGIRRLRDRRARPALGARAVQRLHPWSEPRSLREPGGRSVPTFSIGARGAHGRTQRIQAAVEVRTFRRGHEEARRARLSGNRHRFPDGTYAMRTLHAAPVDSAPHASAIVAQPGPLLCDVQAHLGMHAPKTSIQERAVELLEQVREHLDRDAPSLAAGAAMDFSRAEPGAPSEVTAGSTVTRHRFDDRAQHEPLLQAGANAARRLVVLRDRRLGRPPKAGSRRGSDPPV
jgi:putative transposase